jgi:uncharacterized membrane protein
MASTALPSPELKAMSTLEHDPRRKNQTNIGQAERLISLLAGGGLVYYGTRHLQTGRLLLAFLGGELVRRGLTGHDYLYQLFQVTSVAESPSTLISTPQGITVRRSMSIERSANELYEYWRNVELAPTYMQMVQSVERTGEQTSHWTAKTPTGPAITWESEITEDIPGQLIAWKTTSGKPLGGTGGRVRFTPAPAQKGTTVTSEIDYTQPAGILGANLGKLFGHLPEQEVREDLRRFKQLMEAGEIPTLQAQPVGKGQPLSTQGRKGDLFSHNSKTQSKEGTL